MPVEIEPPPENMNLSAPTNFKGRLRPTPPGFVPEGFNAKFTGNGKQFSVRDFRKRPGHTPGAEVVVEGEIEVGLDENTHTFSIYDNVFSWFSSGRKNP